MAEHRFPRYSFSGLFVVLVALLLLPPLFGHLTGLAAQLVWSSVLLAGLWLVTSDRRMLLIGSMLVLPSMWLGWKPLEVSANFYTLGYLIVSILFLLFIFAHLLYFVVKMNRVNSNLIFASLCAYLLIGLLWGHFFMLIHVTVPDAFITTHGLGPSYSTVLREFIYFSYVTQSTLGYGDVLPVSPIARSWAAVEAVMGQLYLAIVVARLLGIYISKESEQLR